MTDSLASTSQRDVPQTHLAHFDAAMVESFAEVSADPNPIHLDAEVAVARGLPGRIVHGMLIAAHMERFAWECAAAELGDQAEIQSVKWRFRDMTLVGETLTCGGVWKRLDTERPELHLSAVRDSTRVTAVIEFLKRSNR